jgi:hypothetical protein
MSSVVARVRHGWAVRGDNGENGDAFAPGVNPSFWAGRTTSLALAFRGGQHRRRSAFLLSG